MSVVVRWHATDATSVAVDPPPIPWSDLPPERRLFPESRSPGPAGSPLSAGLFIARVPPAAARGADAASAQLAQPVARPQVIGQPLLGAAVFRRVAVFPARQRWHAHEDRFGAATALQAEQGAAVVHQVELHVAATAVQ